MLVQLGDAEAIIPFDDRLPGMQPRSGDRIAAIVTAVSERSDWAQVTLSQSDTRFVEAIFAGEIKEVREGKIELRIARIPGVRSKVAVSNASDERGASSPIGICVGERGSRIRLMRDMLGEEIDLLAYEPDPITFVHAALHPAKVRRVEQADGGYVAIVSEEEQANVAGAGRPGPQARLDARRRADHAARRGCLDERRAGHRARRGHLRVHPPERPPVRQRGRARARASAACPATRADAARRVRRFETAGSGARDELTARAAPRR